MRSVPPHSILPYHFLSLPQYVSARPKRNAILAMVLGPLYAIAAAITGFNPFGVEPWPGVLAFFGGLAVFLYRLRDDYNDGDGAIV